MAKRRGHGEGGVTFHKPSERWVAHVSNGRKYDPETGLYKRDRRYVYAATQEEAIKARDELKAQLAKGIDVANASKSVAVFLDEWLEYSAKGRVAPKTYRSYEQIARVHLKPALGHVPVGKLNQQHVMKMLNDKTTAGLSARTVSYIRAVLRVALGEAMRWDYITRNVAALVKPPRVEKQDRRYLDQDEERQLLAVVKGDDVEHLYLVAMRTGLRQGELLAPQWKDVDLDRGELRVQRTVIRTRIERDADGNQTGGGVQFAPPKTHRSRRTIPITMEVSNALRKQRERVYGDLGVRAVSGSAWQEHDLVFPSTNGAPIDGSNLTHRFHRHCKAAGIDGMKFHGLRHTAASRMANSNMSPRHVMEMLGHSQIATTMEIYSHVSTDELRRALERSEEPEPTRIRSVEGL